MSTWNHAGRAIEEFAAQIRDLPVSKPIAAQQLRDELESRYDFSAPIPLPEVTADVVRILREYAVQVTHPRYFGLFNPSVLEASVVADALVAAFNPQLATWSHAPGANEIERLTLGRLARLLGFEPSPPVFTSFTTGGFEANLSAVVTALAARFPEYDAQGVGCLERRPIIYVTRETHHSFVKICRLTGLGSATLHEVPTTRQFAMNSAELRMRLQADLAAGLTPFMIVGTVGTTGTGAIDPIPELATAAHDFGAWLHVDAAWGGAASLVSRLRSAIAGVSAADSVTWDAHKWLSVPMGAGMFFCRHSAAVHRAFSVSASYMPPSAGSDTSDPYATSVQWSRRAIGLKLFMALAERGTDGMAALIEHQAAMGDVLRQALSDAGWHLANDTILPLVCTTHSELRDRRVAVPEFVRSVNARGKVWISDVIAGNERVVRACITSFRTDVSDIRVLVDELEFARKQLNT
jgi:glutamate/tyrosine decarboxylase-like PLP-dependent enzyme